ncbi:hypothetical protein ACFLQ7_02040 [Actinomycetota bacterium]
MLCNQERARELMNAAGVSAIVATTYEGVLYLSDFDNGLPFYTGTRAAAILPVDVGAPATLIVAMPYLAHLVKAPTWMPDVRCFGSIGYAISPDGVTSSPEADVLDLFEGVGARSYSSLGDAVVSTLDDIAGSGGVVAFDDPSFASPIRPAASNRHDRRRLHPDGWAALMIQLDGPRRAGDHVHRHDDGGPRRADPHDAFRPITHTDDGRCVQRMTRDTARRWSHRTSS